MRCAALRSRMPLEAPGHVVTCWPALWVGVACAVVGYAVLLAAALLLFVVWLRGEVNAAPVVDACPRCSQPPSEVPESSESKPAQMSE